jgi:hypothetical protein
MSMRRTAVEPMGRAGIPSALQISPRPTAGAWGRRAPPCACPTMSTGCERGSALFGQVHLDQSRDASGASDRRSVTSGAMMWSIKCAAVARRRPRRCRHARRGLPPGPLTSPRQEVAQVPERLQTNRCRGSRDTLGHTVPPESRSRLRPRAASGRVWGRSPRAGLRPSTASRVVCSGWGAP